MCIFFSLSHHSAGCVQLGLTLIQLFPYKHSRSCHSAPKLSMLSALKPRAAACFMLKAKQSPSRHRLQSTAEKAHQKSVMSPSLGFVLIYMVFRRNA